MAGELSDTVLVVRVPGVELDLHRNNIVMYLCSIRWLGKGDKNAADQV